MPMVLTRQPDEDAPTNECRTITYIETGPSRQYFALDPDGFAAAWHKGTAVTLVPVAQRQRPGVTNHAD